ncbi:MAG: 4Fe-4S dicluster domain-containing protein [Nitrososphaerota archaeon]|uniref:4Fe-4S dicluster domain-containing protein n=1 Tax=Candidatus Bathycorpusculum sp. TaxID=2994959 RepID=UPI00282D89E8|nr:4Fe-4S dicluster domain-containing protein [Candidatus Termiticorpusculum sp.]MCL2258178.1 4Fe-4S dicluster domain-containing protein [Candidatus Termiticorpusculum sp.]MCL2291495.1 4Fe-4S dicluster domain-containing protein [Candidatus Termiticorpusculum sp.]MDR0459891.1 4Fe-4S dicluster domain-containing protein [Nitrososphaerota archaeon]
MQFTKSERAFVSVDPSKCIGCGLCEFACTMEQGEQVWNPVCSKIRVVRMAPVFNFALSCRGCDDAKCVKSCPEKAITQSESNQLLIIDEKKCKGCDWCVQACPRGGITIHTGTGKAISCNLCDGEPKCVDFCPENALEIVHSDEEADKRFNDAIENLPATIEKLAIQIKNKEWKPLLIASEQRAQIITEKLQNFNKKSTEKQHK